MRGPSIYALMNVECFGKEQTSVLCTDQMSFALVTRQVMIPKRAQMYTGCDHRCGENSTRLELASFAMSYSMCQLA